MQGKKYKPNTKGGRHSTLKKVSGKGSKIFHAFLMVRFPRVKYLGLKATVTLLAVA